MTAPSGGSDSDSGVDLDEYDHVIRGLWQAQVTYRDIRFVLEGRYSLDITDSQLKRHITAQEWYEPRHPATGPEDVLRDAGFDPDEKYGPTHAHAESAPDDADDAEPPPDPEDVDTSDDPWRRYYPRLSETEEDDEDDDGEAA